VPPKFEFALLSEAIVDCSGAVREATDLYFGLASVFAPLRKSCCFF
jgi:hypothetical protein